MTGNNTLDGGKRQFAATPRVTECTQANFDRLPALVSRAEFIEWTGYDRGLLAEEVAAGRIAVWKPKGHTKAKYYKSEIARLGNWKM